MSGKQPAVLLSRPKSRALRNRDQFIAEFSQMKAESAQEAADGGRIVSLVAEDQNLPAALLSQPKSRAQRNNDKFIAGCLQMQAESAQEANELGFMARVLVQATLPHSKTAGTHYKRTNGSLTVEIVSSSKGLP